MKNKKRIIKVVNQIKAVERKRPTPVVAKVAAAKQLNLPQGKFVETVGRRKNATARVRLYETSGDMVVNQQLIGDYFKGVIQPEILYRKPFQLTKTEGKFSLSATIKGSGLKSQLGALVHGIARALEKFDPQLRPFLKKEGLLTRDPRMKETRKPGRGGKARRQRQSPKR